MAKQKSLIQLQGTFQGATFVSSKTYGNHLRATRGTHKPAILNDAFRKSVDDMAAANLAAKVVYDALMLLRADFKGGQLWQRLVSYFRNQYKNGGVFHFEKFNQFEVHADYPMSRLLVFSNVTHEVNRASGEVIVNLEYTGAPRFKSKYVDGYRLTVQMIFPVLEKKMARSVIQRLPALPLTDEYRFHSLKFALPAHATVGLVVVKVEGIEKGEVASGLSVKGMQIWTGIKIL